MRKLPRKLCKLEECPNVCGRPDTKFCSQSCSNRYRTKHKIKRGGPQRTVKDRYCKYCRTKFFPKDYKDSQKFCSMSCAGKSRAHVTAKLGRDQRGTRRSKETKLKLSRLATARAKQNKLYSRCKGGFRPDLQHYVRSGWEANFARYLLYLGKEYEYEPDTFRLETPDRYYLYTPDFKVGNKYYEVKGYWDRKSILKKRLFREQYPDINISYVSEPEYKKIAASYGKHIEEWE